MRILREIIGRDRHNKIGNFIPFEGRHVVIVSFNNFLARVSLPVFSYLNFLVQFYRATGFMFQKSFFF